MKYIAIGIHLNREDIEPLADAVPAAGLFVSAMSVDNDQPAGDRELLVRVGAVRSKLLDRAIFIAVRYGWTFRSGAEAEAKCVEHAARWRALLEDNRGRVELTLKAPAVTPQQKPDRHAFSSGADYLRALHAAQSAVDVNARFRRSVEERVKPLCAASRWLKRDLTSLEFAATIERRRLDELHSAGEQLKRDHPEVPFLLSAPWPLEVFADADHE